MTKNHRRLPYLEIMLVRKSSGRANCRKHLHLVYTLGANSTPDQGCSGKCIRVGTGESVLPFGCADVNDVYKHPVLYQGHNYGADYSSNDLDCEHGARWDLHIMAKFQITCKKNSLVCANISNCLEDDIGNRATRKQITSNEFMQNLDGY